MSKGVQVEAQISRGSLYWLLLAQFSLILPHVGELPVWVFGVCLFCGFWRIQIYREKFPFAGGLTRIILVLCSLFAVIFSFLDEIGLDAAVTFLIIVFFLKLLETRRARDMYVTLFLGYFVAATPLLYSQSLLSMVYALLCYLLLSVALLSLHHRNMTGFGSILARSGGLMLQGLPVLVVLFLFFPRLDPLWMVPMPGRGHSPGVSDTVTPGSFGPLARSAQLAFRAAFETPVPAHDELYWRGLVFEDFDGQSWRVAPDSLRPAIEPWLEMGSQVRHRYTVMLEPTNQKWLFALPLAKAMDPGIERDANFTIRLQRAAHSRLQYRVSSFDYQHLQLSLPVELRQRNLTLPAQGNDESRELAYRLREVNGTPEKIAAAAMSLFNQQAFYYTLNPPALGDESIDGFLLRSKKGYCEHYASAFVFLMRAAGVPARMVGGYMGGEINPFDDYIRVRQMDAHVWAEVWLADRGWVRFDPTAQVAPDRIYRGVESILMERNEFHPGGLLGLLVSSDLEWVQVVRLWWDAVNYGWSRWFLNYDRGDQLQWMQSWFGKADMGVLVRVLALSLVTVFMLLLLWVSRGLLVRRHPPAHLAALAFSGLLGRLGSKRCPAESMIAYCARVAEDYPDLAHLLADFAAVYSALAYANLRYHWFRRQRLHWLVAVLAGRVLKIKLGIEKPSPRRLGSDKQIQA